MEFIKNGWMDECKITIWSSIMKNKKDRWMISKGWKDGWIDGHKDEWMPVNSWGVGRFIMIGWMDEWKQRYDHEWNKTKKDGWMDGYMNVLNGDIKWMDAWYLMDE